MNTRKRWLGLGCLSILLTSVQVYAGGPLLLRSPGVPFLWPNGGRMIPFNPDQGGLGPMTNAEAVAQSTAAFKAWADIPSATATHVNAGSLSIDVDETNFEPFLEPTAPDGLSAIVYDEDGAIFNLLFGPGSGVLGFAGPEWINETTGAIVEGVSFMNGGSLVGPGAFPVAEFLSVQVHEYGHYQNLAHTIVNGQIVAGPDSRGPSPNNTFPPPPTFQNRIETMYPFLFINGGQATPHADDIAIFSSLYPEPTFAATTGTITGSILGPNGTTPLTGVNVIARNIANPYDDAVSAISSDFTDNFASGSPFVGVYTLRGLTPGASYAIYVDAIIPGLGGFSTPPRALPGPEEFYNGPLESSNGTTDMPNVFTPVVGVAAVTIPDIDIIFNATPPGPIPAGDDTSTELFLKFPFKFCGETFDSVFVNSNGNLTFGAADPGGFLESPTAHLTGPPRVAGLWDDLNAAAGGSVSYSETSRSITISFTDVPEFVNTGANTFAFTLFAPARGGHHDRGSREDSSRFTIAYGDMTATDGLAGYSCGGRFTSGFEQERDLSRLAWRTIDGEDEVAIFEAFTAADNDLDNRTLRFIGPEDFRDPFEPNDSPTGRRAPSRGRDDCDCDRDRDWDRDCNDHGRHGHSNKDLVSLPFSTVNRFSAIEPFGDDVDFFRFRAKAGEILAIETVAGRQSMDTFIGLFDSDGNLLIADDDSGTGLLSRLLVQIPVGGTYAVGVTTFGDPTFTGTGGSDSGRYVLNISSYTGTLIAPGDDGSVEVPLGFSFPFQGANWASVFVNGNGNLTFGEGNDDFSESVAELLSGPPRIAPLWDDLFSPLGLVIAEPGHKSMTIHFVSVPEFLNQGTNYFSVRLDDKGTVTIDYQPTNRSDALVGLSQGQGAADPGPTDLSEDTSQSAVGTTYERFLGSFATWTGVDLSFNSVEFKKKKSGHGH